MSLNPFHKVNKPQEPRMANGPGDVKPKMLLTIECFDNANVWVLRGLDYLADIAKEWNSISLHLVDKRNQLVKTFEAAGGMEQDIETAVHKEYAPKKVREEDAVE